jgi:hypothetical protein
MMKVDRFYKEFKKLIDFRIRLQRKLILQLSLRKQGPRKKRANRVCSRASVERRKGNLRATSPTSVRN